MKKIITVFCLSFISLSYSHAETVSTNSSKTSFNTLAKECLTKLVYSDVLEKSQFADMQIIDLAIDPMSADQQQASDDHK